MSDHRKNQGYSILLNIIVWGSLWGIFEATVGYLLHLVSFGYSWVIWYPFACFIMTNVYRKTGLKSSILLVGFLCASIKMLNLLLPGRIDKVINPAISIVFEAIAMAGVVLIITILLKEKQKSPTIKSLMALMMNTGWRVLFILYLLFLVPDWMQEISVMSNAEKFIPFFITQNLITSVFIFIGYQFKTIILKPIVIVESRISSWINAIPKPYVPIFKTCLVALMLCANIALQYLLK